jgi:hypothetical protein
MLANIKRAEGLGRTTVVRVKSTIWRFSASEDSFVVELNDLPFILKWGNFKFVGYESINMFSSVMRSGPALKAG